jgi:site-specific DNA recombinase
MKRATNGLADRPRCAIYARVSTDEQVEKYGLAAQLTETRRAAKQRGYTVVKEFVEPDGASGKLLWDRPQLSALRDFVNQRGADVVLAIDPDRLSRGGTLDYLVIAGELRQHGTRLEYLTFTPDDTDEGRCMEQMFAAFAELERKKIIARTSRGSREKARQGKNPHGAVPFGYRRDGAALGGLAVCEPEAKIVRRIFAWVAERESIRGIAARLNTQSIAAPRGGRWGRSTIWTLLQNRVYVGEGVFNRRDRQAARVRAEAEWIRYPVPPLVSKAQAARVKAQLERNKALLGGRPAKRVYLLGGLARCGRCGRRMHGELGDKGPRYRCAGRHDPNRETRCCFSRPAPLVDARAWDVLAGIIREPDALLSHARATKLGVDVRRVDAATEVAELGAALEKAKAMRARLLDLFLAERIERADLDVREPRVKSEILRLEKDLAAAEARANAGAAEADRHAAVVLHCRLLAKNLARLDEAGRQRLMRQVVSKATLQADGRLELEGALQMAAVAGGPAPGRAVGVPPKPAAHFGQYPWRLSVSLDRPC